MAALNLNFSQSLFGYSTAGCQRDTISDRHRMQQQQQSESSSDLAASDQAYAICLQRRAITRLTDSAFQQLNVWKIELSFNPIGDRISPTTFQGLGEVLQDLSLAGCHIRLLPNALISDLTELRYFRAWGNRIERIPLGFFQNNTNLVELSLWANEIRELGDTSLGGLNRLKRLDLDRNRISIIRKDFFRHVRDLEVLNLSRNRINSLVGETFVHLSKLKALDLTANGLGFLHAKTFKGLDGLLSLSLSHNQIGILPDAAFTYLQNLTTLRLQHNQLEYVWARTFAGLRSLRTLDLSNNRLSNLHEGAFRQLPQIINLYLENNRLKTLKKCSLPALPTSAHKLSFFNVGQSAGLGFPSSSSVSADGGGWRWPVVVPRRLSLIGNPMQCDCRMYWLTLWVGSGTSVWGTCSSATAASATAADADDQQPVLSISNSVIHASPACEEIAASAPECKN